MPKNTKVADSEETDKPEYALTMVHVNALNGGAPGVKVYAGGCVEVVLDDGANGDSDNSAFVFDGAFCADPKLIVPATRQLDAAGLARDPRLLELVEQVDKDGDGKINLRELQHFFHKRAGVSRKTAGAEASTELDVFDVNADGAITFDEMCKGLAKLPPAEVRACVSQARGFIELRCWFRRICICCCRRSPCTFSASFCSEHLSPPLPPCVMSLSSSSAAVVLRCRGFCGQAESWIVQKLKLTRQAQYASSSTLFTACAPDASSLDEALFTAMVEPCVRDVLSMNCLLLGAEKGTGKAAALFGAGSPSADVAAGSSSRGGGDQQGLFYRLLARLFKLIADINTVASDAPAAAAAPVDDADGGGAVDGSTAAGAGAAAAAANPSNSNANAVVRRAGPEFLVAASFVAVADGRNEVVDLLRSAAGGARGPKVLVVPETANGSDFPLLSNATRVALASEDDFAEHWAVALQRLRMAVLPQEEGATDPCGANFVVTFDVEQRQPKLTTGGEPESYRTASLRFANFRAPTPSLKTAAPTITAAEAAQARTADVLAAACHLATTMSHASSSSQAAPARKALGEIAAACVPLQLVRSSLWGTSRCVALAFVAGDAAEAEAAESGGLRAQLALARKFQHLRNTPAPRYDTQTLLQEQKEEKARLLERMKHEQRAFQSAQEQDREMQQEQKQTALQRRLAQKKVRCSRFGACVRACGVPMGLCAGGRRRDFYGV
jgi:hypothetical protein